MNRSVLELLKAARAASLLECSEFGEIFAPKPGSRVPYPTCEKDVTEFIRDRVRNHHRTWIQGPIDGVIEILYGEDI